MAHKLVLVGVMRAFSHSIDGFTVLQAPEGFDTEIHADIEPGLRAEGYVGDPTGKAPPIDDGVPADRDSVVIPENWQTLDWPTMQDLALALIGKKPASKKVYAEAVQAELARREAEVTA